MRFAVAVVVGYLAGSVPVALLVARRTARLDLRAVGDRNPGYWNAKAQLGRRAALPVFVGDTLKGVIAGVLGVWAADGPGGHWAMAYVAVGAAMVGHAFPVFAGFRGGRSILAFAGGVVVVSPRAALLAIGALVVVTALTRRFAWGARVGVFGFPMVQAFLEPRARVAATGALLTFIGLRFVMAAVAERRRSRSGHAGAGPSGAGAG